MAILDVEPKKLSETPASLAKQPENVPELAQADIDAEALAIAKRRMERHAKTWTELAKH